MVGLSEEKLNVKGALVQYQVCFKSSPRRENLSFFSEAKRIGAESPRPEMVLAKQS